MVDIKKTLHIQFLQLPRLENDSRGEKENLPMAGFYLSHALERTKRQGTSYRIRFLSPEEEALDDGHLIELVAARRPDIVCATLYLWNIERTLDLLRRIRRSLPEVVIICGGPEVASGHPFLFKSRVPDVAVAGEGEAVFPLILNALAEGGRLDFDQVAWKMEKGYVWGSQSTPVLSLSESLPPLDHPGWCPDDNGMAYLEAGRGCPMRCSYCRYSQMRRGTSFLNAEEVVARVRILKSRGATQIRFVDPTFNANPAFGKILAALKSLNKDRAIKFFAELQADALSRAQIRLLSDAGFTEVEVGLQSRDPRVLRNICRPVRLKHLEENLRRMSRSGIRVTLDLMYGLPEQTLEEVLDSLKWARTFRRTQVQCLQTLLLPGTALRESRKQWKMKADHRPPYAIHSTGSLAKEDILEIEEFLHKKYASDCMTRKFVGRALPDLFLERLSLDLDNVGKTLEIPGSSSRRAIIFQGKDLYSKREKILAIQRRAIRSESHMLWQFVLCPDREEPLNLLEDMIAEIRRHSSHWIDRFACVAGWERVTSRRVFVLLNKGRRYDRGWSEAAEKVLEDHFF